MQDPAVFADMTVTSGHSHLSWFPDRPIGVCFTFNPLNAALNPTRHLLALVGDRHIVHVSRIRVNLLKPSGFFTYHQV